jgi:hypothetical protein
MKWISRFLFGLLVLGIPAIAHAQATTAIRIVVSGGAAPVTNDLPIGGWLCGQVKVAAPPGTAHNPTKLEIDDPSDNTKACIYTDTGVAPSPLVAIPFGATVYTATAAFLNSVGAGPVSVVSNPFDHPGAAPANAPTGLKVLQ